MKFVFQVSSKDTQVYGCSIFRDQERIGHIYRGKHKFSLEYIKIEMPMSY